MTLLAETEAGHTHLVSKHANGLNREVVLHIPSTQPPAILTIILILQSHSPNFQHYVRHELLCNNQSWVMNWTAIN
jgi:hypothetical protein